MKKHSVLYVKKFAFARERFIEKFADSSLFEVVNVAKNIKQALELIEEHKPSIIVTGTLFEDGTVKDLIKEIEAILNFRPHIVIFTVLSFNEVYKYSYGVVDHAFYEVGAFDEEVLARYFENLLTSENTRGVLSNV